MAKSTRWLETSLDLRLSREESRRKSVRLDVLNIRKREKVPITCYITSFNFPCPAERFKRASNAIPPPHPPDFKPNNDTFLQLYCNSSLLVLAWERGCRSQSRQKHPQRQDIGVPQASPLLHRQLYCPCLPLPSPVSGLSLHDSQPTSWGPT